MKYVVLYITMVSFAGFAAFGLYSIVQFFVPVTL